MIERLIGGDENARKLIDENFTLRLNNNGAFRAGHLKLAAGRLNVMGELWEAGRQPKIHYSMTFGISEAGTIELHVLVVVALESYLCVDTNIRNRLPCYGMSCLDADAITISFAHRLSGRDQQFKNIGCHLRHGDDSVGESFSRRFLRTEPVVQSVPKYAMAFFLVPAGEGKWEGQSERLAATRYRLNLSCRGDGFIAWVDELELNVCIDVVGRRIVDCTQDFRWSLSKENPAIGFVYS